MLKKIVGQFKYNQIIKYLEENDFSKLEYLAENMLNLDFNILNELDFYDNYDFLKKYNFDFIFKFLEYWDSKFNILKEFKGQEKEVFSYFYSLLEGVEYKNNSIIAHCLRKGLPIDIKYPLDGSVSSKVLFDRIIENNILRYLRPKENNSLEIVKVCSVYHTDFEKGSYYIPEYMLGVEILEKVAYKYACNEIEDYLTREESDPFDDMIEKWGLSHLELSEAISYILNNEFPDDRMTDLEKKVKKWKKYLENTLNRYMEDEDPLILKGYVLSEDDEYLKLWEEYPEYFEEPSKFEDRVKSKISCVRSYLKVATGSMALPMDLADKYRGVLNAHAQKGREENKGRYVHDVSLFDDVSSFDEISSFDTGL